MVSFLLDNGANVNHTNHAGDSALLIACYDTNRALTNLLVQHGADVLVSSKEGLSPIWYACANNQKEIVWPVPGQWGGCEFQSAGFW